MTTDFGLSDSYVAQMKGVILQIAPDVSLVDITHKIPAQDCTAGAAVLAAGCAALVFGAIAVGLDEGDMRPLLDRVLHAGRLRRPRPSDADG